MTERCIADHSRIPLNIVAVVTYKQTGKPVHDHKSHAHTLALTKKSLRAASLVLYPAVARWHSSTNVAPARKTEYSSKRLTVPAESEPWG